MSKIRVITISFLFSLASLVSALMKHPFFALALLLVAGGSLAEVIFDEKHFHFSYLSVLALIVNGYILIKGSSAIYNLHYALLLPLTLFVLYNTIYQYTILTLNKTQQLALISVMIALTLVFCLTTIGLEQLFGLLITGFHFASGLWYVLLIVIANSLWPLAIHINNYYFTPIFKFYISYSKKLN